MIHQQRCSQEDPICQNQAPNPHAKELNHFRCRRITEPLGKARFIRPREPENHVTIVDYVWKLKMDMAHCWLFSGNFPPVCCHRLYSSFCRSVKRHIWWMHRRTACCWCLHLRRCGEHQLPRRLSQTLCREPPRRGYWSDAAGTEVVNHRSSCPQLALLQMTWWRFPLGFCVMLCCGCDLKLATAGCPPIINEMPTRTGGKKRESQWEGDLWILMNDWVP